jgi:hypothetical protein
MFGPPTLPAEEEYKGSDNRRRLDHEFREIFITPSKPDPDRRPSSEPSTSMKSDEAAHNTDRCTILTSMRTSSRESNLLPPGLQRKTIEDLPNEVLLAVFACVEFSEENWKAPKLTCHRFNRVMIEHTTSLITEIGHHQFRIAALLRKASTKIHSWLLNLCQSTCIIDSILCGCKGAEELTLPKSLVSLCGSRCPNVVRLELHLVESLGKQGS